MKKCLVIELWMIGDAAFMTSALQGLLADGWEVTVLARPQTQTLLGKSFPSVHWIDFEAPWTAFYGKYKLWRWPWRKIFQVRKQLKAGQFDAAISIRKDPRQHFFLLGTGIRRRIGFASALGRYLLNETIPDNHQNVHRVEDWWAVQQKLSSTATTLFNPKVTADPELAERFRMLFARNPRPVVALHCGARIAVRRWPEAYYFELIAKMRREFDFQLVLIPDLDGYGSAMEEIADHTLTDLKLAELQAALSCATQLICNDSGPGHVADALGVPVIAIFGPADPEKFRPFGKQNLAIIRDICPYHPCSDYCRFPEPFCLTRLTVSEAWPQIRNYLIEQGRLPQLQHQQPEANPGKL